MLVLIEPRLAADESLRGAVATLVSDLAADGFRARAIAAQVYAGPRHQDGRTLLAMRSFFRGVRELDAEFAGALLIGAFPEAFLVRSCSWRRQDDLVFRAGTPDEKRYAACPNLRMVPEPVADRCEVVLCDLDGRWDEAYVEPRERLATLVAAYPGGVPAHGGVAADFEKGSVVYEDFFHVDDGRLSLREALNADGGVAGLDVEPLDDLADRECSSADLARGNRIARPDIVVSRIDARGVALKLRAEYADEHGRPRKVEFAAGAAVPPWYDAPWEPDPALERRLLLEFLDRDHRYRRGELAPPFKPASLECGLGSGFGVVKAASASWSDFDEDGFDVGGSPTLVDVVAWLRRGAVLRTIRAHSDAWGSVFAATDCTALERALGGAAWSFSPQGSALVPSLQAACAHGKQDFFLLRSLWESGLLPKDNASFYLHTGCQAVSPPGAARHAYSDPAYDHRQGAEALLFYAQGLALVGRAKVFYDEPRGFCEALREGKTFGEAWARYFEIESDARSWDEVGGDIGRKRSYFWSVIGDWTLRLRVPG